MELDTHKRKIFDLCDRIGSREAGRASEVGEDREEIGSLIELTGINKKAFAFVRSLDKMEGDKREDVLRSLDPLLQMFEGRWNGEQTPDMFGGNVTPIKAHNPEGDAGFDAPGEFEAALAAAAE